jgi:hypothetical protein
VCHHPSISLNKEKVSREISENKIAVCEKTQSLRSGNFSDLNSACSTVLVPVKIFQFQDMHYENCFLDTFQGHSKRPIIFARDCRVNTKRAWLIFGHVALDKCNVCRWETSEKLLPAPTGYSCK